MADSPNSGARTFLMRGGLHLNGVLEIFDLAFGQGQKEGLEQHDGFPEARIEIEVGIVQAVPVALWLKWRAIGKFMGSFRKILPKVVHKFLEGGHLVK
jgi:hypothetical protein